MKIENSKTHSRFNLWTGGGKPRPYNAEILPLFLGICLLFASSVPAFSWTQTDWSEGDSQCLWYAADRYDTGVYVDTGVEGQISIDTIDANEWQYKRPITLVPATSQDNYQVKVELTTEKMGNPYDNVEAAGEDIRFYDADHNSLSYWIEEWDDTGTSTIWVKVTNSGTSRIYMYYGNSSASSASNGTAVFEFFDDMETWSGWTKYGSGEVEHDNTRKYEGTYSAHKTTANDPNGAYKDIGQTLGRDIVLEFWLNRNSGYGGGAADRIGLIDNSGNGYGWRYVHSGAIGKDIRTAYSGAATSTSGVTSYTDTWVEAQFIVKSNNEIIANRYVGGSLDGQHSSSDSSYSSFTRVYIFGGHDYWVDLIRIRKYASSEPAATVGDETTCVYYDTGVLLSSTYDADSPVVWKTIEWNDPSIPGSGDEPYRRGDSRLRKDEGDLRALWHFDEGVGLSGESANNSTVYDESTYSNTGIVHGCKWGDASEDSAVFQSALSFDGSGDYINCGHDASLNITDAITVEAWFNTNDDIKRQRIVSKGASQMVPGGRGFILEYAASDDIIRFITNDGTTITNTSQTQTLLAEAWHHLAGTMDSSGNQKLYFDGVEVDSDTGAGLSSTINDDLFIGKPEFFNGSIDEVAIFSYAKNAEEIWQDAQGTQIRLRTQTTSSILDGTGADSPVGLWHFDNLENDLSLDPQTAYDSSVYGNHGELKGDAAWSQYGVFGKCLSFDGSGDYVDCGNDLSLNITDEITVEAWFNTNDDTVRQRIVSKGASQLVPGGRGFILEYVAGADIIRFATNDGTTITATTQTQTALAGVWHHLAGTMDSSGNQKLYFDGVEVDSDTGAGLSSTINDDLFIGKPEFFNGLIDEVAIYPRAKTPKEIAIDAREGSPWSPWSPYYKDADIDDIVLFTDDFNDGVIGGDWTPSGPWLIDNIADDTGALKITTGTASDDTGIILASDNTDWYNYQVETKIKLATGGRAGIILNWNDGGIDYNGYAALLDETKLKLYKMNADGSGVSYSGANDGVLDSHSFSLTTGQWYTLKAQYDGSHIRVYLGDTNHITYNVTDYTYKGHAALIVDNNTTACFDDFKVHPIDRYVRYEATLTDNMCNDTTPYLYWVRLSYEETSSDDSIWSRIIQDRSKHPTYTPKASASSEEFDYSDIDGADTVWCYNLRDYDSSSPFDVGPDEGIKVHVSTLADTIKRIDLRLGIREVSTLSTYPDPNTWPENTDDYVWYDWIQHKKADFLEDSGDTILTAGVGIDTWILTYEIADLTTDFATEGGYIFQARAVSNDEGTEKSPTNFQPNDDKDRRDSSIIYMMKDITPPGSSNLSGGWTGQVGVSGYQPVDGRDNDEWTTDTLRIKGVQSSTNPDGTPGWYINSENTWINYLSQDDSGIVVSVEDKNPDIDRESDCSGLKEKSSSDSPTRYVYSINAGDAWHNSEGTSISISTIDDWSECDTDIVDDIRYLALGKTKYSEITESYNHLMPNLGPNSTKGENVLIQFAQKDKAGNWGYSHPDDDHYYARTGMGYYINYDITKPEVEITAGPREANYSSSASFEFKDDADDSPLLCAFSTRLETTETSTRSDPYSLVSGYDEWTSYQPWLPTSDEGSATFTDLVTNDYWYRCIVKARDEALNESADYDTYYFQCLTPVPNTIIYSGPAGIVTDDDGSITVTFKFKGEGGTPAYVFAYNKDGNGWELTDSAGAEGYKSLIFSGYGNHTFRVRAANSGGTPEDSPPLQTDPTPACVTFTIEDPDKPSAIAPPSDPVKYWREESE